MNCQKSGLICERSYAPSYLYFREDFHRDRLTNIVSLQIGDTQKVLKYYANAFEYLQQRNCCEIAKAFISFIEPKKRVNHPYSGVGLAPVLPLGIPREPSQNGGLLGLFISN